MSDSPLIRAAFGRLNPEVQRLYGEFKESLRGSDQQVLDSAKRIMDFTSSGDSVFERVEGMLCMAIACQRLGVFDEGIGYATKALEVAENLADKVLIAKSLNSLANLYTSSGDHEFALAIAKRLLDLIVALDDQFSLATACFTVGRAYSALGKHEEALAFTQEGLSYLLASGNTTALASVYNNIAIEYGYLSEHDKAYEMLLKAKDVLKEAPDRFFELNIEGNLAGILRNMGRYDDAIASLLNVLDKAKTLGNKRMVQQTFQQLQQTFQAMNRKGEAYQWAQELYKINRELFDEAKALSISRMQVFYETKIRDRENELYRIQMADLEELNQKLVELTTQKDHLVQLVADHLRAPIGRIGQQSEELASRIGPPVDVEGVSAVASEISRDAVHMLGLVSRLLSSFAADQEHVAQLSESVDIHELIFSIATGYHEAIEKKRLTLQLEIGCGSVLTDPRLLRQIVDNLVSNAVKFSHFGGLVCIESFVGAMELEIVVRDTGPGFKPADRPRMFQRFNRLSAHPTGGEPSFGLGLHAVKVYTERLSGTIEFVPQSPKGSLFRVTLPVVGPRSGRNENVADNNRLMHANGR